MAIDTTNKIIGFVRFHVIVENIFNVRHLGKM